MRARVFFILGKNPWADGGAGWDRLARAFAPDLDTVLADAGIERLAALLREVAEWGEGRVAPALAARREEERRDGAVP